MPRRYRSYVTAWRRSRRRFEEGVWFRVLYAICDTAYSAGKLSIDTIAVDSTLVDSKKVENSQATMVTKEGKPSKFMHQ
jgi:hypothetical protein